MANYPTLYQNFERVKDWIIENFPDKETLAYILADVAFSGDYNDLINTPDMSSYTTYSYVTSYVSTRINELIDGAPAALDTLNELAAALGDDANFATTVTNALGTKADSDDVYTKTQIQNMSYITMTDVEACGYTLPLSYTEMNTLFPLNS